MNNKPATSEQPTDWIYKFWRNMTWDSESKAKERIKARIVDDNERYTMFKPNDPNLVDSLRFTRARGGKVRLLVPRHILDPKSAITARLGEGELPEDGVAPDVSFTSRDLQDRGTPVSIAQEFAIRDCVVYKAWVRVGDVPKPTGAGIVDGYPDLDGAYDWRELQHRGEPPAPKLRVGPRGKTTILDGNHRCAFWRERDYTYMPAWVVDERPAIIEAMRSDPEAKVFSAADIAALNRNSSAVRLIESAQAPRAKQAAI